jgi:hypothetical protein
VPNWLIVEAVGFPVAVIVLVVLGSRHGSRSVSRHPLNNRSSDGPIRATAEIVDAGCVAWPDLLDALAAKQMDPDGESPRDAPEPGENGIADVLGLRSPIQSGRFRPNLMYGTRAGRQVFIRLGIDETLRSGFGTRHLRQTTVLRVGAPSFTLCGIDGVPYPSVETPQPVRRMVQPLQRSPDVWTGLYVQSGPDGIVATRPIPHRIRVQCQWLYDLWLLERIADYLRSAALSTIRLGANYRVPYGLGRSPKFVLEPPRSRPAGSQIVR